MPRVAKLAVLAVLGVGGCLGFLAYLALSWEPPPPRALAGLPAQLTRESSTATLWLEKTETVLRSLSSNLGSGLAAQAGACEILNTNVTDFLKTWKLCSGPKDAEKECVDDLTPAALGVLGRLGEYLEKELQGLRQEVSRIADRLRAAPYCETLQTETPTDL